MRNRTWASPLLLAAAFVLSILASGVAKALERDPRAGQFYTNEEILKLSGSERNAYCEAMEDYLEELREEADLYNGRLDSLDVMADTLRTRTIEISAQIREVNSELRELRLKRKSLTEYTSRDGDTLRSIAKILYGDPLRWEEIYDANKAKVADPNAALPVGTVLAIPRGGR
ncbi:MAG: LysM peptidoglycan-binding domain-containing protein [Candidatus Eisenbacteria bacterium]